MRYLADECFDARIVRALRDAGANVAIAGDAARGAPDKDVLQSAASEDRILLTKDKDFGALVFRDDACAPGVVLLRMDGLTSNDVAAVAVRILALPDFGRGAFTTIDAEGERARPLP
jgi:predicted nuclease of predicted toxin-antitoxin system